MKIGFISNGYYPTQFGGAERSVQLLAESVMRQGHEAAVLTLSPNEKFEVGDVNGIRVTYLPQKNVYGKKKPTNPLWRIVWHLVDSYNPWMRGEVSRWLKKEKPDLVQTNTLGGITVSAWDAVRNFDVPLVHTLREYYLQCRLMSLNRHGVDCNGICEFCKVCAVPRRARSFLPQAVVGTSRYVLDSHLNAGFFPGVPIQQVIYNPFQAKTLSPVDASSNQKLRLGYIGRIEKLKGIEFLLQEVQTLDPERYELYIAGTGEDCYLDKLKKLTKGITVHWLGYMQPAEFFPKVDLLIVPSLWQEPFGRVIVEAYGYGVPVLATRVGGIPEIVVENVTGFFFDANKPGDFQRKVNAVSRDYLLKMRSACLDKTGEFEPDNIGAQYLDLFSRVQGQWKQKK